MKQINFFMMLLVVASLLVVPLGISVTPVVAQDEEPVYTCLPTCVEDDARFITIDGVNLATLVDQMLQTECNQLWVDRNLAHAVDILERFRCLFIIVVHVRRNIEVGDAVRVRPDVGHAELDDLAEPHTGVECDQRRPEACRVAQYEVSGLFPVVPGFATPVDRAVEQRL